jgi:hypothetical protein
MMAPLPDPLRRRLLRLWDVALVLLVLAGLAYLGWAVGYRGAAMRHHEPGYRPAPAPAPR